MIFFCVSWLWYGCEKAASLEDIVVYYEANTGVSVSFKSFQNIDYQVFIKQNTTIPVLGEWSTDTYRTTFTPVIPFTPGASYLIKSREGAMGTFQVCEAVTEEPPKLLGVYPKLDTVPENLLKMYVVFSKPMQEVRSALDFIRVIDINSGKEVQIFLPLETELWNADHTELTLWLDPGRIKKDLIPHKKLGIPVKEGNTYDIIISPDWSDARGNRLREEYKKRIVVGKRDTQTPDIKAWTLVVPSAESDEGLHIIFDSVLDAMLIEKNIQIADAKNQVIAGDFLIKDDGESVFFHPKVNWKIGYYKILINSSLEDLSGNNLNRLFDTDLQQQTQKDTTQIKTISFRVQ